MTRIVLGLLALLGVAGIVSAQCYPSRPTYYNNQPYQQQYYRQPYYNQPTYNQPTYNQPTYNQPTYNVPYNVVAPIAVPVIVPATVFQYLPALQPITTAPVAVQPATPGAVPNLNSQQNIDQMIRERLDQLLRERLGNGNGNGNGNGDKGPPTLILPSNLNKPAPKQNPPTSSDDLDQKIANMLSARSCVQCHTKGDRPVKGNVVLFVKNGEQMYFQPSVSWQKLYEVVAPTAGRNPQMPPEGPYLTADEVALLKQRAEKK